MVGPISPLYLYPTPPLIQYKRGGISGDIALYPQGDIARGPHHLCGWRHLLNPPLYFIYKEAEGTEAFKSISYRHLLNPPLYYIYKEASPCGLRSET
jgi:hypothetical protein